MRLRTSFLKPMTSSVYFGVAACTALMLSSQCASLRAASPCGPVENASFEELGRKAAEKLIWKQSAPAYPPIARVNYIHGAVRLLLTVDCSGSIDHVHVLRGNPILAAASVESVRTWEYHPWVGPQGPHPFQTIVNVNFRLSSHQLQRFPARAEEDLARSVRPPVLVSRLSSVLGAVPVRLRVLVDDAGRVMDTSCVSTAPPDQLDAAQKVARKFRFQPARWGNMQVPWYADVEVPLPPGLLLPNTPPNIN
jgi:TonB family protein